VASATLATPAGYTPVSWHVVSAAAATTTTTTKPENNQPRLKRLVA